MVVSMRRISGRYILLSHLFRCVSIDSKLRASEEPSNISSFGLSFRMFFDLHGHFIQKRVYDFSVRVKPRKDMSGVNCDASKWF